jgi:hypothetical protein
MAEVAEKPMTIAEFLAWDGGTDTRYELIGGRPIARALPRAAHSVIVATLGAMLQESSRSTTSGMRLEWFGRIVTKRSMWPTWS